MRIDPAWLAQCLSFSTWNDERYIACARHAADIVASRGLLKKGFGICHGISGSGLSLLCMHRADSAVGGKTYAEAAARMALFACFEGDDKDALLRQPDRPQSLMEGEAGLGCFLAAVLESFLPQSLELHDPASGDKNRMERWAGGGMPWLM